ncbi:MAG: T9SS type A sorting domain-containing protein [Chlorobi bacterium]|nr:T9SS type A sorting domain-containing protein [Chlorobiota bacterium]
MKNKFYLKHLWITVLFISMYSLNTHGQIVTSSADYPGIVKFSASESSANGLVYEVMPGPSVINPDMNPTPFSDSINMSTGSYSLSVADIDSVDSPSSQDSVTSVNILFTGNDGRQYKIDKIMIIHKPEGAGDHTFFGGVGLNKQMHGNTGIGTNLMPKMMAYITLWGLTNLKDAVTDTVIAANRIIHLMVATNVRDSMKLDTNVVVDRSDYNIKNAHTHVILPPLNMAGEMDPIPGTDHGFLHMMFEKPLLTQADKDWTLVYEVLPGPAVMNPMMNPTPFSDNIGIAAGSYSLALNNLDPEDSPDSRDSVIYVNINFERPNGDKFMIDKIMIIHKPEGAGDHTFFGGIGYNKLMHGNTGIGTGLMPKMTAYATLWGITDLKDGDGNVLASNRIIHMMVASRVRTDDLSMIPSAEIDSSDYDPGRRETHVILPPLNMNGDFDPVPGTGHGFLHLMYEKVLLADSTVSAVNEISASDIRVIAYPNPFNGYTSIEYQIEHQSDIKITVYNSNGSLVKTLVDREQSPGTYKVRFDANSSLPAGMYFYVVTVNGSPTFGKLSLIR